MKREDCIVTSKFVKTYNMGHTCMKCGGRGCDKCHQGFECTKFTEEYYKNSPKLKDPLYGTECYYCQRGWRLGGLNGESPFETDDK